MVITCASHAQGPRFDPGRKQYHIFFMFFYYLFLQFRATTDISSGDDADADFIDVYLAKIRGTADVNSSFYGENGRLNLQRSLTDLFGAGSETTSTMLSFAFLYMIKHPQIQRRVHEEISSVLAARGGIKLCLDDRPRCPYTDATLHEVMRHACLVYAVPHAATEDAVLPRTGHRVPAGASVYANVYQVMHNPAYWRHPSEFRPERFLDPESGKFRRDERCIPFMMGKRYCIGQTLAQDQLFLFFAGLINRFEFRVIEISNHIP